MKKVVGMVSAIHGKKGRKVNLTGGCFLILSCSMIMPKGGIDE